MFFTRTASFCLVLFASYGPVMSINNTWCGVLFANKHLEWNIMYMQDNIIKARVRLQNKWIFLFILYVRTRKETEWKQAQNTSVHTQTWYIRLEQTAAPSLLQVCQLGETVRRPRGPLNLTTHSFQFRYFSLGFLTSRSHESRKTKFILFSFQ